MLMNRINKQKDPETKKRFLILRRDVALIVRNDMEIRGRSVLKIIRNEVSGFQIYSHIHM